MIDLPLHVSYRVYTNNYFLKHDNHRARQEGNTEKTGDNVCVFSVKISCISLRPPVPNKRSDGVKLLLT